jgi:hypothetical protein
VTGDIARTKKKKYPFSPYTKYLLGAEEVEQRIIIIII